MNRAAERTPKAAPAGVAADDGDTARGSPPSPGGHPPSGVTPRIPPERVVEFRPRTILQTAGVLLGLAFALWIVYISLRVVTWVFVALFLALALNPAVQFLQAHGLRRRGAAAAVIYASAIAAIALLAALFVPPLADEAQGLADAAPGYVKDVTAGRGPLGFLERDYHVVERVRAATASNGGSLLGGSAGTALDI